MITDDDILKVCCKKVDGKEVAYNPSWNVEQLAKFIGYPKSTVYSIMKRLGLTREDLHEPYYLAVLCKLLGHGDGLQEVVEDCLKNYINAKKADYKAFVFHCNAEALAKENEELKAALDMSKRREEHYSEKANLREFNRKPSKTDREHEIEVDFYKKAAGVYFVKCQMNLPFGDYPLLDEIPHPFPEDQRRLDDKM